MKFAKYFSGTLSRMAEVNSKYSLRLSLCGKCTTTGSSFSNSSYNRLDQCSCLQSLTRIFRCSLNFFLICSWGIESRPKVNSFSAYELKSSSERMSCSLRLIFSDSLISKRFLMSLISRGRLAEPFLWRCARKFRSSRRMSWKREEGTARGRLSWLLSLSILAIREVSVVRYSSSICVPKLPLVRQRTSSYRLSLLVNLTHHSSLNYRITFNS